MIIASINQKFASCRALVYNDMQIYLLLFSGWNVLFKILDSLLCISLPEQMTVKFHYTLYCRKGKDRVGGGQNKTTSIEF